MTDAVDDALASFLGRRIPGGCESCDAYQVVQRDPDLPSVWHVAVHHDDWCPVYRQHVDQSPTE